MAKTTGKPQASAAVTEQPAPSPKRRKKGKAPAQPRSSGSVQVPKTTAGVKRSPQGSLRKKAPLKASARPRVPKKARGPTLFGHYHKFNKKLNLKEPSEDQESMEKATTSSNDQSSQ